MFTNFCRPKILPALVFMLLDMLATALTVDMLFLCTILLTMWLMISKKVNVFFFLNVVGKLYLILPETHDLGLCSCENRKYVKVLPDITSSCRKRTFASLTFHDVIGVPKSEHRNLAILLHNFVWAEFWKIFFHCLWVNKPFLKL